MNLQDIPAHILFEENEFKEVMTAARKKGTDYIKKLSDAGLKTLKVDLMKDLSTNYVVSNLDMKLGRFRGINFVTTSKLSLKPKTGKFEKDEDAADLLAKLKDKYSPKFKLKSIQDGIANFNIR